MATYGKMPKCMSAYLDNESAKIVYEQKIFVESLGGEFDYSLFVRDCIKKYGLHTFTKVPLEDKLKNSSADDISKWNFFRVTTFHSWDGECYKIIKEVHDRVVKHRGKFNFSSYIRRVIKASKLKTTNEKDIEEIKN